MNGLMMDWPLLIPSILRRAAQFFADKEIVSRRGDGAICIARITASSRSGFIGS